MRKLSLLLIAMALGFGIKAQCPLQTAIDFTATDCHGTEVHLFDILDGGQYVLIDFFFYNCGACNTTAPMMVQSYQSFGCNMHDVFYMEISDRDSDAVCQNWVANYGVEYPTISGTAGGSTISDQYLIGAFPTVILIRPDRQIVIQDLWPINNVQSIITALENQGVEQHPCVVSPEVSISIDLVTETEVTVTFTPNEDCASYAYTIATESEIQEWMNIAGLALPEYLWNYGIPGSETLSHTFNGLTPEIEYTVYAVPADLEGNLGEVVQETVTTTSGGSSETMPDFTGIDLEGNEIHLYDILDGGQAVLIYFFHSDYDPCATVIPYVTESYAAFGCNQHDVFFMEISSNDHDNTCQIWTETHGVKFPTISRDGGGNDIAQSIPVAFYPTVMIIRPDHTFSVRDLYPLVNTQTIIDALKEEGYEQYLCYEQTLTLSADTLDFCIGMSGWNDGLLLQVSNFTAEPEVTITSFDQEYLGDSEFNAERYYFVYEGVEYWSEDPVNITIPQGETIDLYFYVLTNVKSYPYYSRLTFNNTLESVSIIAMLSNWMSSDESTSSPSLFPNPANDFVTLSGENLGTVRVYNTIGQKVDEFEANGTEIRISTTNYENGVYFIKSDVTTMRLVITH